jgi:hypothetical protein
MDLGPSLERIAHSTAVAGMQPAYQQLGTGTALVARASEFRWRWMATRLHTFLVVAPFPPGTASRPILDSYLRAASDYAIAHKGGLPRGVQSGTAIIPVAVTSRARPEAIEWASKVHGRRFAVIPYPALLDASSGQTFRPERMVVGGIYGTYLRGLVDQHVG